MGAVSRKPITLGVVVGLVIGTCAQFFASTAAHANDWSLAPPPPDYRLYAGIGAFGVHHTGYVPNTKYNSESYHPGAKVFVGYMLYNNLALELGVDYMGTASFNEGLAYPSKETSVALTGTAIYFTPPLSEWLVQTWVPTRAFVRGGLAYKQIHQEAANGTFDEGILSFVIGGGAEVELSKEWFLRGEYEFISTAVGGPSEPFAAINGAFTANFGGTYHVINVMHTELAVAVGRRF